LREVLLLETEFTRLVGCQIPIQQAGMAALANPELAAAVSGAGALGMVSVGGFPPEKVREELHSQSTDSKSVWSKFSHPEDSIRESFRIVTVQGLG
jgi:nitronate monooxygenase